MTSTPGSVRFRAGWLAAGALGGLALAVAFGPAFAPKAARAVDPTTSPEHTISVTGTGIIKIAPDVADLSVGVNITRPTVKEARAVAAQQMTAVLAALAPRLKRLIRHYFFGQNSHFGWETRRAKVHVTVENTSGYANRHRSGLRRQHRHGPSAHGRGRYSARRTGPCAEPL